MLHQNAIELSAMLPAVACLFAFNKREQEQFYAVVGSLGLSSLVAANPLAGLAALVMAALSYKKAVTAGQRRKWLRGLSIGGARSSFVIVPD